MGWEWGAAQASWHRSCAILALEGLVDPDQRLLYFVAHMPGFEDDHGYHSSIRGGRQPVLTGSPVIWANGK